MSGVNSVKEANAYTKAGNPYHKTNNGKKAGLGVGTVLGVGYGLAHDLYIKNNWKGGYQPIHKKICIYGVIAHCILSLGLGAVIDAVKNNTARKVADAKAEN